MVRLKQPWHISLWGIVHNYFAFSKVSLNIDKMVYTNFFNIRVGLGVWLSVEI